MKTSNEQWSENADELQMSLIKCPRCHRPTGWMSEGESGFFCFDCKVAVIATVTVRLSVSNGAATPPNAATR